MNSSKPKSQDMSTPSSTSSSLPAGQKDGRTPATAKKSVSHSRNNETINKDNKGSNKTSSLHAAPTSASRRTKNITGAAKRKSKLKLTSTRTRTRTPLLSSDLDELLLDDNDGMETFVMFDSLATKSRRNKSIKSGHSNNQNLGSQRKRRRQGSDLKSTTAVSTDLKSSVTMTQTNKFKKISTLQKKNEIENNTRGPPPVVTIQNVIATLSAKDRARGFDRDSQMRNTAAINYDQKDKQKQQQHDHSTIPQVTPAKSTLVDEGNNRMRKLKTASSASVKKVDANHNHKKRKSKHTPINSHSSSSKSSSSQKSIHAFFGNSIKSANHSNTNITKSRSDNQRIRNPNESTIGHKQQHGHSANQTNEQKCSMKSGANPDVLPASTLISSSDCVTKSTSLSSESASASSSPFGLGFVSALAFKKETEIGSKSSQCSAPSEIDGSIKIADTHFRSDVTKENNPSSVSLQKTASIHTEHDVPLNTRVPTNARIGANISNSGTSSHDKKGEEGGTNSIPVNTDMEIELNRRRRAVKYLESSGRRTSLLPFAGAKNRITSMLKSTPTSKINNHNRVNILAHLNTRSMYHTKSHRYMDSGYHGMRQQHMHRKWQPCNTVSLDLSGGASNAEITCMEFDSEGVLLAVADSVGCVRIYDFDEVNAADMLLKRKSMTHTMDRVQYEEKSFVKPFITFRMGEDVYRISSIRWNPMDENMLAVSFYNKAEVRLYDVSTTSDNGPTFCRLTDRNSRYSNRSLGNWTLKFLPSKLRGNSYKILVGDGQACLKLWKVSNSGRVTDTNGHGQQGRLLWSSNPFKSGRGENGGITDIVQLAATRSPNEEEASGLVLVATSIGWFALIDTSNCSRKSFSSERTPLVIKTWNLSHLGGVRKHILPSCKWMGVEKIYVWADVPTDTARKDCIEKQVTLGVVTSGGWFLSLQFDIKRDMNVPKAKVLYRSPTVVKCDSTRTTFYKDSTPSVPEFSSVYGKLDSTASLIALTKTKTMYQVLPDSDKRVLDQNIASGGLFLPSSTSSSNEEDGLTIVSKKGGDSFTIPIKGKLKHLAIHPDNEWMVAHVVSPHSDIQLMNLSSRKLGKRRAKT